MLLVLGYVLTSVSANAAKKPGCKQTLLFCLEQDRFQTLNVLVQTVPMQGSDISLAGLVLQGPVIPL